ncbi:MAG: GHMP kinase [Candidatus Bathyarchaeota archaeon]|nr:GHMP kinase [Candidatus Bathyarchaeum tardum]
MLREVSAFSPAHISGFFQIFNESLDPLFNGSRGAGVSLKLGVTTKVTVQKSAKDFLEIKINGKVTKSAEVSKIVVDSFNCLLKENYKILVDHEINVPMGAGYGSSGAGALSLALALNEALQLRLSTVEAAQIAHTAEVQCKTGLGSVIAETVGGLEIREKPGAPGVGKITKIPVSDQYVVACLFFGPISTKTSLSNPELCRQINDLGGKLVDELIKRPEPSVFMNFSRKFAEGVGLISERMRKVLVEVDAINTVCSMNMFGECIFSLVKKDSVEELLKIFYKHNPSRDRVFVSEIDPEGARVLW